MNLVTLKLKLTNPPPDLSFKSCPETATLFPSLSFHIRQTPVYQREQFHYQKRFPSLPPFKAKITVGREHSQRLQTASVFPLLALGGEGEEAKRGHLKGSRVKAPWWPGRLPKRAGLFRNPQEATLMRQWVRNAAAVRAAGVPTGIPGRGSRNSGRQEMNGDPRAGRWGGREARPTASAGVTPGGRAASTEAAGTQAAARPLRAAHLRDVMFLPPPAPHGPVARSGSAGHRHMEGPERGPAREPTRVRAEPAGRENNPRQAWIPDTARLTRRPARSALAPPLAAGACVTSSRPATTAFCFRFARP